MPLYSSRNLSGDVFYYAVKSVKVLFNYEKKAYLAGVLSLTKKDFAQ
jgi:hypothetical protein